jgi:hypothetical protein
MYQIQSSTFHLNLFFYCPVHHSCLVMTQYFDGTHLIPDIPRHFNQIFIFSMHLSLRRSTIASFTSLSCSKFIINHLFLYTIDLSYRSIHRQYALNVTLLILRIHRSYLTSRFLHNIIRPSTVS